MGASRKQLITLAVAVAILAAIIWWQSGADTAPVAPSEATTSLGAQQGMSPRAGVVRIVPVVALARLKHEAVEPSDTGRDPFRFGATGPGAGRGAGATPPVMAPPPMVRPVESAVPAGPPPPPPIPFKFIAIISKRGGPKIAMLTDGRGVYYGTEGSVIEGQYRIVRISQDSIEMTYLDGRGRKTIPLAGT